MGVVSIRAGSGRILFASLFAYSARGHIQKHARYIGIARGNGCPFVFPPWPPSRHFEFPIPQSRFIREFERRVTRTFAHEEIMIDRATELRGYFQSERYFTHCEEEVRHYFTPHHALADLLERQFGDLIAAKTCSVHVRRTDIVGDPAWPELAAGDYYERAMSQFDSDTTFAIFSDDIEWCKQRFRDRDDVRLDSVMLIGKVASSAPQTALDFVENQQRSGAVAQLPGGLEELGAERPDSALALNRLQANGANAAIKLPF